jgi:hypothetical protein
VRYDDFLLKLYKSNTTETRYQAQVLVPDSADGGRFDLPLTGDDLDCLREQSDALRKYAAYGPTFRFGPDHTSIDELVKSITIRLYKSLPVSLQGSLRESLQRALERERGLRIGIMIDPSASELAELPWEMLRDPEWSAGYLAQTSVASIVRVVGTSLPVAARVGALPPIRANNGRKFTFGLPLQAQRPRSVLIALVGATEELRVAGAFKEAQLIKDSMPSVTPVDILDPPTTLSKLEAKLKSHPYQVLHIITHGYIDKSMDLAYLIFDAPGTQGGPEEVVGERLRRVLHSQPALELLVLSACRSAAPILERAGNREQSRPEARRSFLTNSLSAQITSGVAMSVVGMQIDIVAPEDAWDEDAACSWAGAFYTELEQENGVEYALAAARRALTIDKDPILWAAPVLSVPLYWVEPPLPLYAHLDHWLYQRVAAIMEENGQVLMEGVLIAGLLLISGFSMAGLLTPTTDATDASGMFRVAWSLFITLAILPAVISGTVMVLAARQQPALRALSGRNALAVLRTGYAGAGLGIFTVLGVVGMAALVLHFVAAAHPILSSVLAGLLQLIAVGGVVLQGMVFAGRYVRVGRSVVDEPQIYDLGLLISISPLILGLGLAVTLPTWYPWLLAEPTILLFMGATLVGCALWVLRSPPAPRS